MICSRCQSPIITGARFCDRCGTPVATPPVAAANQPPADARRPFVDAGPPPPDPRQTRAGSNPTMVGSERQPYDSEQTRVDGRRPPVDLGQTLVDWEQTRVVSGETVAGGAAQVFGQLLGRTIDGRYRIDRLIASSGAVSVYGVTRLLIGDEVAMKIRRGDHRADPLADERFRREALIAARLKHPNTVSIYDFGVTSDGLQYLVTELVEGKDLRQIIKQNGPLDPLAAAEIISQVCAALVEAHRQHLIHREIKPECIVIHSTTDSLRVKVLDFGIATLHEDAVQNNTQTATILGTPQYMSPEQCLGEELDSRSDIYSLGIVLYEMLCGQVPFDAPVATAVIVQQVNQPPRSLRAINASITQPVEDVVFRALSKQRDGRPPTAAAFSRELLAAVHLPNDPAPVNPTLPLSVAPVPPVAKPAASPIVPPIIVGNVPREREPLPITQVSGPIQHDAAAVADEPFERESMPVTHVSEPIHPDVATGAAEPFQRESMPVTHVSEPIRSAPATLAAEPLERESMPVTQVSEPIRSAPATLAAEPLEREPMPVTQVSRPIHRDISTLAGEPFDVAPPNRRLPLIIAGAVGLLLLVTVGVVIIWSLTRGTTPTAPPAGAQTKVPPAGMAYVPGGEFKMGTDGADPLEKPAHTVVLRPFFIDIYEVTREEYANFVKATGHSPPPKWINGQYPSGTAKWPVTGVDWDDATAYAQWMGKRLPTEEEWEFAARGTDGRKYPWGNDWLNDKANVGKPKGALTAVGSYKSVSPFGLFDMVGNAWEWTSADWAAYPGGSIAGGAGSNNKVIRGGSFLSTLDNATTTFRSGWPRQGARSYEETSFRCAMDVR